MSKTMSITHAENTLIHDTIIYDMFSTLEMWTSVMFPLHLKQLIFLPSLSALSNIKNLSDFFDSTFCSKPPLCSLFHSQFSPIRLGIHVQQTAMNFFFHVPHFSHYYVATANTTPSRFTTFGFHAQCLGNSIYSIFVDSGLNGANPKRKDISMLEGNFIGSSPSVPSASWPVAYNITRHRLLCEAFSHLAFTLSRITIKTLSLAPGFKYQSFLPSNPHLNSLGQPSFRLGRRWHRDTSSPRPSKNCGSIYVRPHPHHMGFGKSLVGVQLGC